MEAGERHLVWWATAGQLGARAAKRVEIVVARHPWRWMLLFAVALFCASAAQSLKEKMWIDEIHTYYIARQPTVSDVIAAIREGADGAPPLYFLIVREAGKVLGNPLLALRLPAALGICIMCICVFAFTYRRLPALYAFTAMLLAVNTCRYFATEGRPYGLLLACAAVALVCWQMAAEGKHRIWTIPILALSLALGIAFQYYSIFMIAPLFAGEVYRWRTRGRLDWPILIALAVAPLVLIPHLPIMQGTAQFARYFWSKASLHGIADYYTEFYLRYLALLLVPLLVYLFWPRSDTAAPTAKVGYGLRPYEQVVCVVTVFTPAMVVLISMVTTKVFVTRYVAWAAMGYSIGAAAVLYRVCRGNRTVPLAAAALLLVTLGAREVMHVVGPAQLREAQAVSDLLPSAPADGQPIVVADHHIFMELAFYAPPALRSRLVYPVSAELDRHYTNVDTGMLALSALRHRAPLNIPDYNDFMGTHSRFILAASSSDWLVWHLMWTGWRVTPLGDRWNPGLFEVERQ